MRDWFRHVCNVLCNSSHPALRGAYWYSDRQIRSASDIYSEGVTGSIRLQLFSPAIMGVVRVVVAVLLLGVLLHSVSALRGDSARCSSALHNAIASLPTSDPDTNLTLRVANAAYYNQSEITVLPGFSQNIQRFYGGALKPFEQTNPEAAINSWVEEVTDGMIQNFLPPGHFTNSETVIMLLNAVFFEGFWENQFSVSLTSESNFTTATGTVVRVPMMYRSHASISFKNIEALNAQVIELPYKGDRFSLFVIMPNTWDGLINLERRLDGQMLSSILNDMPPAVSANLFLPKFRLSTGKELNDHLKTMGLRTAFSRRADFRRMSDTRVRIEKVLHKAIIEVTETGSRAAAVTSVELVPLSRPRNTVQVNKPFVFILRDKTSGLNFFMGRVTDPSQE
ncbi:serpin B4-like [Pomacea canaliculata]|uniref:serpin B4-like n=1 Tax=Pomacea canaliculata TaxID=400727 RepID=UPI000D732B04|nr:serpin B4-like [Pomacea canaliculata]